MAQTKFGTLCPPVFWQEGWFKFLDEYSEKEARKEGEINFHYIFPPIGFKGEPNVPSGPP